MDVTAVIVCHIEVKATEVTVKSSAYNKLVFDVVLDFFAYYLQVSSRLSSSLIGIPKIFSAFLVVLTRAGLTLTLAV